MLNKSHKQKNSDSLAFSVIIEISVENLPHLVLTSLTKYKELTYAAVKTYLSSMVSVTQQFHSQEYTQKKWEYMSTKRDVQECA